METKKEKNGLKNSNKLESQDKLDMTTLFLQHTLNSLMQALISSSSLQV